MKVARLTPYEEYVKEVKLGAGDISRLIDLATELADKGQCTPTEAIDTIERLFSPETSEEERQRAAVVDFVSRVRRLRSRRNAHFGAALFRDPAWDMLLELYVSHERRQWLTVTALCNQADVPSTTALRYLDPLEENGLVTRNGYRSDSRLSIVRPTEKALADVEAFARALLDEKDAIVPVMSDQVCCDGPEALEPAQFSRTR